METLKHKIRTIADFPKAGIQFKDIMPIVRDPISLRRAIELLIEPFKDQDITAVAGMEARGFIFGSLVAWELDIGFIPLRKAGKLPHLTTQVNYDLEYGSACLEVHTDAIKQGDKILLIDDLIATGGTAKASCELVEKLGGEVAACAFLVELTELAGREHLSQYPLHTVIKY